MGKFRIFLAAGLLLGGALFASAQDKGYWRAASSAANSITGDIAIAPTRLTINFSSFPLAEIRRLTPAEVSAVFAADINAGANGDLYRLKIPAEKRFLHHNTLCGTDETEWMATYVSGRELRVAFFSGSTTPQMTIDAMNNSSSLCGVFTYSR
ncbi:MAG: hypothetical protein ACLGSH_09825 [Acidobacteriota bacterium]